MVWYLQLAVGSALLAAIMLLLWLYATARRDASIVDVGWSAGLGILAVLYGLTTEGYPPRVMLVAALAALWSLRLAGYLFVNRIWGRSEDGRYQTLRARWGPRATRNFFWFFQFQALLSVLFSIPFLVAIHNPTPDLGWADWLGTAIWIVAVLGETIADLQLARFRSAPHNRGKTCRRGLWNYSRHPNYFFEWLHWWAYVGLSLGNPWWPVTLLGPAAMLFFLFKVTGIPATERQALASRGEDYRQYQRTTSPFIPWFPHRAG